jgi:hypothetical protein
MVDRRRVTVARAPAHRFQVRANPSMSARRTANRASERLRHQVANWRRQWSASPAGLLSRLLPGVEVGGHGGWGKRGAVDGDVGEAAGEEVTAALQHPGPQARR